MWQAELLGRREHRKEEKGADRKRSQIGTEWGFPSVLGSQRGFPSGNEHLNRGLEVACAELVDTKKPTALFIPYMRVTASQSMPAKVRSWIFIIYLGTYSYQPPSLEE